MIRPGFYNSCYISYMQSPYHVWFVTLGYPELDILQYDDGEWHIIQYYNSPVVPSMTQWQSVLGPMRNVEISFGFCAKYIKNLDLSMKAFWDREEGKTKEMLDEHEALENHKMDMVERASQAFLRNPHLMERIARNGIEEMDLRSIEKHLPRSAFN